MKGIEHLAFHMGGPTELMVAGTRLVKAGFESFWGPGRHKFGSNWFWYFNSPLGTQFEYDADMDKHDDSMGRARRPPISPEASQMFLLQFREKWIPGPGPEAALTGRRGGQSWKLCRLDDLGEGQARGFAVAGLARKVILVRRKGAHLRLSRFVPALLERARRWPGRPTPISMATRTHLACHSAWRLSSISRPANV